MGQKKDTVHVYDEKVVEYEEELPPAYEPRTPQKFPVVNKFLSASMMVYASEASEKTCKEYKCNANSSFVLSENSMSHGIPLLEVSPHYLSSKFFTLKRYIVPKHLPNGDPTPFNKKTHYYDHCLVRKKTGLECSTYSLQFLEEEVMVFYHNVMPVVDYQYKGVVYRWVNQKRSSLSRFLFTLYRLGPERSYSVVDSWDSTSKKLVSNHPSMKLSAVFSIDARRKKPELYQDAIAIGEVRETKKFGLHACEITLENNYAHDYDSINSVDNSMLVHLTVALIIKRYQDILEERRRRSN